MKTEITRTQLRIPQGLKMWIEAEAEKNLRSMNAEIIKSLRDRMVSEQTAR
jgi:hypothetical protein